MMDDHLKPGREINPFAPPPEFEAWWGAFAAESLPRHLSLVDVTKYAALVAWHEASRRAQPVSVRWTPTGVVVDFSAGQTHQFVRGEN